jgi:tetratricopeptide (TPR) repeat protein
MINWELVWRRLSSGQHVVLCGVGPVPDPDAGQLRLSWVDCETHPEPGGTIEAARRRIDRDLDVNPWMDVAAQRLRSSLRRHLLGDDTDGIDAARDEHIFRRSPADGSGPRPALLLSGVDRADLASIERLTRLFAGEHPPTWPLLIRFDAHEPSGAARALLEQLERVLPAQAIFQGAERDASTSSKAPPVEALAQLSRESLRVLRAAATIGDRFEIDTLSELLQLDDLAVLDAVQEAMDRGLSLEDRGQGVFRFEPRIGNALRASTLPALSIAWHRRLAELFGGLPAAVDEAARRNSAFAPAVEGSSESVAPPEAEADDRARAARHAEAAGLSESAADSHLSAAVMAMNTGRYAVALEAAGRALASAGGAPEPARRRLEARALLVTGQCRWLASGAEAASLERALDALEGARERTTNEQLPELRAEIASMLANVCYDVGTPRALEQALVEVTRAGQLWLDAGRPLEAARLLNDEAALWVKRDNPVRAKELLERSREVFGKLLPSYPAARLELLETEHLLARLVLHSAPLCAGESQALQLGMEHALLAEAGYRSLGEQRQLGRVWETLGRLQLRLGRLDEASEWFERAHRLQRETGDAIGSARSAGGASEVFAARHDYPRALNSLAESAAFNSEKGSAAGLQHNLASLRRIEDDLPDALVDRARGLGQRLVRALGTN